MMREAQRAPEAYALGRPEEGLGRDRSCYPGRGPARQDQDEEKKHRRESQDSEAQSQELGNPCSASDSVYRSLYVGQKAHQTRGHGITGYSPAAKDYLSGALNLVAEFEISELSGRRRNCQAILRRELPSRDLDRLEGIRHAEFWCNCCTSDVNNGLMLVANVEFMQLGKAVPVPSRIWFKFDNGGDDLFAGPVYVSSANRALKAVGTYAEWELNAPSFDWCFWLNKFKDQKVQGATQIMDGVTCDAVKPQRQGVVNAHHPGAQVAILRVLIEDEAVRVEFIKVGEFTIKVCDVLTGPLNFQVSTQDARVH
jgi:hypothetical protein